MGQYDLRDRVFCLTDGFVPNGNANLGRPPRQPGHRPHRKHGQAMGGMNLEDFLAGGGGGMAMAAMGENACKKVRVLGIDVCAAAKKSLITGIIIAIATAGLLSGMAVIAVLRAMRYRKDLTRLTAQVAQLRR